MEQKIEFKFSEGLADRIKDALIDRIVDAIQQNNDTARNIAEYGHPNINEMDGVELMDEYMTWHGVWSIEDDPDDTLLCRMIEEHNSFEFEKEALTDDSSRT